MAYPQDNVEVQSHEPASPGKRQARSAMTRRDQLDVARQSKVEAFFEHEALRWEGACVDDGVAAGAAARGPNCRAPTDQQPSSMLLSQSLSTPSPQTSTWPGFTLPSASSQSVPSKTQAEGREFSQNGPWGVAPP